MFPMLIAAAGGGVLALIYAMIKARWIYRQKVENKTLIRISGYIAEGAEAFLFREYKVLVPFVLVVAAFLAIAYRGPLRLQAIAFALGTVCSAASGWFGMKVATAANSRTAEAADKGVDPALRVAFTGGSVMGMTVVGLAMLGITIVLGAACG
jgi:K(+)-stimulated pyrophosphate-energized sodium pump